MRLWCCFFLAVGVGSAGAQTAPAPDAEGSSICSPRSRWRFHHTLRPAQSYDPRAGKLNLMAARYGALNTLPSINPVRTPEPPPSWTAADFDDSAWPVVRAPLPWMPEMDQDGTGPYSCFLIRKAVGRTRFLVPEKGRVSKLRLELRYHGGVIVFVNGKEVGRGHIPKGGILDDQDFADPYPEEAYQSAKGQWWGPGMVYHRWNTKDPNALALIDRIDSIRRRTLKIEIPASALITGVNVLAVENRLAPPLEILVKDRGQVSPNLFKMPHIGISELSLTPDPPGSAASAEKRPEGVQAWAHDIHQWVLEEDFLEPGVREARVLRLAAPRNGAASAQAVLGTSRDLPGPSAVLSDLAGPGGAKLPPAALRVRWARSLEMKRQHDVEARTEAGSAFRVYMHDRYLVRYRDAPVDTFVAQWTDHEGKGQKLRDLWAKDTGRLYLSLSDAPPEKIAAGVSQPVWITAEIPPKTAPGTYTGTLTLRAAGMKDAAFTVRLQVFDATLPDPKEFTAYAGVDQSPWALAKWTNVALWSPEHWSLIEQSLQWGGKLGARVVGIPVIHKTELNNGGDTMIKWVRRADGKYDLDFTLADRYLDLWRKYGHQELDVLVYVVVPADGYGRAGGTGTVTLIDPQTKQEQAFAAPPAHTPEGLPLWVACAKAIRQHFNAKGLKDSQIHWGLFYDYIGVTGFALAEALAKEIPEVGWARSSHMGSKGLGKVHGGQIVNVTWSAGVRALQKPPFSRDGKVAALQGWNNANGSLLPNRRRIGTPASRANFTPLPGRGPSRPAGRAGPRHDPPGRGPPESPPAPTPHSPPPTPLRTPTAPSYCAFFRPIRSSSPFSRKPTGKSSAKSSRVWSGSTRERTPRTF